MSRGIQCKALCGRKRLAIRPVDNLGAFVAILPLMQFIDAERVLTIFETLAPPLVAFALRSCGEAHPPSEAGDVTVVPAAPSAGPRLGSDEHSAAMSVDAYIGINIIRLQPGGPAVGTPAKEAACTRG